MAAVRAADDRKALDISAVRVSHLTSATSFFVNMAGRSKAQINAIVKNIEDEVKEQHGRVAHRQGKALGGWVCLDFDSVVVNVFSEEQRQFYGVEKFWAAGQPLDLSDVVTPDAPAAAPVDSAVVDEIDDWELDDEDIWSLDDEWSLEDESPSVVPFDFAPAASSADAATPAGSAVSDVADVAEAGWASAEDDEGSANPFAAFAAEAPPDPEPEFEVRLASVEDEEEADAALDEGIDSEADWALGDDKLRALVEEAERGGEANEGATGSDWRSMMEADGWDAEGEDLADALSTEAAAKSEEEEDDGSLDQFA